MSAITLLLLSWFVSSSVWLDSFQSTAREPTIYVIVLVDPPAVVADENYFQALAASSVFSDFALMTCASIVAGVFSKPISFARSTSRLGKSA